DNGDAPEDGRLATLEVDFSRFGTWYEIDSFWEGRFLEQIERGAFRKTIAERGDQVKILFNHGFDMYVNDKVLGVPEVLEERKDSPHMEAGLLDTSYNRDLLPGLRAGAYGSSFMFEVLGESWEFEPEASDHNPEGIPERTVNEVRLYEAGPVTWPANPEATAGVRSGVDWYAAQLAERDQDRYDELLRSFTAFRALHGLDTPTGAVIPDRPGPESPASDAGSDRHVDGAAAARARARRLQLIDMAR
ncbi:MAG: HK97 family phage prohead protease, partial [Actinomycetota bacterium]